jgi:hypothetical protein
MLAALGIGTLFQSWSSRMSLGTILLIILIVLLVGAFPSWPYSSGWGYYPAGGIGTILVIVLILLLLGRI